MKDMLVKLYDLPQKCEELEHLSKTMLNLKINFGIQ